MSISEQELLSIGAITSSVDVEKIIEQSKIADDMILKKEKCPMLSKLHKVKVLCPESLNPDDTILNKLARGDIGPGTTIMDDHFAVINDRNMPLGGTSCGPNGVLYSCGDELFGPRRINLFHKDVDSTMHLARAYIAFRNARLPEIFNMYVNKMCSFLDHWKIDPGGDDASPKLAEEMRPHYANTCKMLQSIQAALRRVEEPTCHSLEALGISVVSFCQTWSKNGEITEAQFSVMSPHFQTRFYISDETKLPRNASEYIESYSLLIDHFTSAMIEAGYRGAFVNVDRLISGELQPSESAFVTGIPAGSALIGIGPFTKDMVIQVQENHLKNTNMLTGKYKLIGNSHKACSLILNMVPAPAAVKSLMIQKLCSAKTRKVGDVSRAMVEMVGEHNKEKINVHMFSTLQWKVIN
jgi:hypothetical protein